MENIFNMYIEDAYSCAMFVKLARDEGRTLTFKEMEDNALYILGELEKRGYKTSLNLSRDMTNSFLEEYKNMVSYDGKQTLTLNKDVSLERLLRDFHMGVLCLPVVLIMNAQVEGDGLAIKKDHTI